MGEIGLKWWMAENLKVTRFRNGDEIPNRIDDDEWDSASAAYYSRSFELKRLSLLLIVLLALISCHKNPTESEQNGIVTGTIRDVEGNIYKIIRIGKQWWMAENLRVTQYRNGEWIINVTGSKTWSDLTVGAYCYYDNDFDKAKNYGNLYNWNALVDRRNLAPEGWHIPTDDDWQELVDYLGGETLAGGEMKSVGSIENNDGLWAGSNESGTDEFGFSALPAGYRNQNGLYNGKDSSAYFWSSTEKGNNTAVYRYLNHDNSTVYRDDSGLKQAGYSIRCVRD